MPYLLEDLVIDRVDLVDEGANSAAFIELFKRKEQSNVDFNDIIKAMKPEHATVIQTAIDTANDDIAKAKEELDKVTSERDTAVADLAKAKEELDAANEDLAKANSELETLKAKQHCECDGEEDENGNCKSCGLRKAKNDASFDETETLKSMPEAARKIFEQMKAQKEAAEAEILKAKEKEEQAEALAKAKEFKSIPMEEDKLVSIIKGASSDILELLTVVNAAIEGTVLNEVGKSNPSGASDAWTKIEAEANKIVEAEGVTKEKAISKAIQANPELYTEYLKGGAR